jgi:hypothetical protein
LCRPAKQYVYGDGPGGGLGYFEEREIQIHFKERGKKGERVYIVLK